MRGHFTDWKNWKAIKVFSSKAPYWRSPWTCTPRKAHEVTFQWSVCKDNNDFKGYQPEWLEKAITGGKLDLVRSIPVVYQSRLINCDSLMELFFPIFVREEGLFPVSFGII